MQTVASPTRKAYLMIRAGLKRGGAVFRSIGLAPVHAQWQQRAEICQRCPLVVEQCGKTYCGRPFLEHIDRDQATEGCGCPVIAKAKDPHEHCPRDAHFQASRQDGQTCTCTWCTTLARGERK